MFTQPILLPLLKEHYQDGNQRVIETGHRCPECLRYFDNTTYLKGHREAVHGIPDPNREREKAHGRRSEARRRKRKAKRRTRET